MDVKTAVDRQADRIRELPIRDLVEIYPETMTVLNQYGMDLCCGGGHTVAEAARLHGHDPAAVVSYVSQVIQRTQG